MNIIEKRPVQKLGYDFIPGNNLPNGKDEYHLRNVQNKNSALHRKLTAYEIESLVRNRNTSDDWNNILVSDAFRPEQVKNCKFYGLVRIGKLEPFYLEFKNLRLPVGLYNSTIISCDFGDNVVIDNVDYISHYIVGNDVMIVNVNELATTEYAKFGNGILKEGELEKNRIWMEICNENAGRAIIPFNGMLPGDAFLWSRFRDDDILQDKFKNITERIFDKQKGYYGKIGDRTVIKNCKIIKDVWIGTDAYLKGANKLKNLTIDSSAEASSQIGEGCEIVNGIIGVGCRIFYGVKAVRFIMASHSQLKYGARLINSYLGNNATISCCEVLNSLIFPAHEQHHNNSFLCAALIMGQSNIAAGATIGSNHNSRSADGEIVAGRGFWPGLCVSLKHNSKFASYTILAKGDYQVELNIPIPFSLVSNDVSKDQLIVMPGYWFMYNMYALARNAWKYVDRDNRIEKKQFIEYDFLAPDTINEIIGSLKLFKKLTGIAYRKRTGEDLAVPEEILIRTGEQLLEQNDLVVNELEILAEGFENSRRKVSLIKVLPCYHVFKDLIEYYAAMQLISYIEANKVETVEDIQNILQKEMIMTEWINVGGQLIVKQEVHIMLDKIRSDKIQDWEQVHAFYLEQEQNYPEQKLFHALFALHEVFGTNWQRDVKGFLRELLLKSSVTKEWISQRIFSSRAKDYDNVFRQMVYDNLQEMNKVLGKLEDNTFIQEETLALTNHQKTVQLIIARFELDA
ncbi:MAG: DUF4954 family protein [Chitinophagaceae bacterium]